MPPRARTARRTDITSGCIPRQRKSALARVQCQIAPELRPLLAPREPYGFPPIPGFTSQSKAELPMLRCRERRKGCSAAPPARAPKGPPQSPHDGFLALALAQQNLRGAIAPISERGLDENRVTSECIETVTELTLDRMLSGRLPVRLDPEGVKTGHGGSRTRRRQVAARRRLAIREARRALSRHGRRHCVLLAVHGPHQACGSGPGRAPGTRVRERPRDGRRQRPGFESKTVQDAFPSVRASICYFNDLARPHQGRARPRTCPRRASGQRFQTRAAPALRASAFGCGPGGARAFPDQRHEPRELAESHAERRASGLRGCRRTALQCGVTKRRASADGRRHTAVAGGSGERRVLANARAGVAGGLTDWIIR